MRRKLFDIIKMMSNRMSNRTSVEGKSEYNVDMLAVGRTKNMLQRELLDT